MFRIVSKNKRMSGLDSMKHRLMVAGGNQDGRNVKGKWKSMDAAKWNSYQGEWITFNNKKYRCLINPDKLSTDYDQKEISIDFCSQMHAGDVFYWNRTKHWWIVLNERVEEEAYFRASCRKCQYQIGTNDEKYWIWLRGPAETALVWKQKHQISINDLNYSISLYVTKNEDTLAFFSRHQQVKFDGHNWKVAATDKYSQEGIIEVYLEEDFDNTMLDNMVIPEITEPDVTEPYIDGPQSVNPYDTDLVYTIKNADGGTFVVNSSKVKIDETDENSCSLTILTGKSAKFKLLYQREEMDDIELDVTINSF